MKGQQQTINLAIVVVNLLEISVNLKTSLSTNSIYYLKYHLYVVTHDSSIHIIHIQAELATKEGISPVTFSSITDLIIIISHVMNSLNTI